MTQKTTQQIRDELDAAIKRDQELIDDKNVDTTELEEIHRQQAVAYLAARDAARARVLSQ